MKGMVTTMPESEARKRWVKENKVFLGLKLHRTLDADILAYLEGKQYATEIKKALRYYIEHRGYEESEET